MLFPTEPFDQTTVLQPPAAVSVTLPPLQIVVDGLAEMLGAVSGVTVTVTAPEAALLQSPILQMAVYEVVAAGLTVMLAPTEPFDHSTEPAQPVAVKVALSPEQISALFVAMVGVVGPGVTVTVAEPGVLAH